MGGMSNSTPQVGASPMSNAGPALSPGAPAIPPPPMAANMPLSALFMNNGGYGGGYQQTPVPQIHAPAYPTPTWTPQQAQAATIAQMRAITPYVQPQAPVQQKQKEPDYRGGNGSASGRGSGGAW